MRLSTIWGMPAMTMRERIYRTIDWSAQTAASKLPKRVKYWATLQSIAMATRESPNVPATSVDEILPKLVGGPK